MAEAKKDTLPPEAHLQAGTLENFDRMARDRAAVDGGSPKAAAKKLSADMRKAHESDPSAGWDHLADVFADRDPAGDDGSDWAATEKARLLASARQDPRSVLAADPEVQKAAEDELAARAEAGPSVFAKVDKDAGTGPLTAPAGK